jgi:hypothetical protein
VTFTSVSTPPPVTVTFTTSITQTTTYQTTIPASTVTTVSIQPAVTVITTTGAYVPVPTLCNNQGLQFGIYNNLQDYTIYDPTYIKANGTGTGKPNGYCTSNPTRTLACP